MVHFTNPSCGSQSEMETEVMSPIKRRVLSTRTKHNKSLTAGGELEKPHSKTTKASIPF